MAVSTKSLYPYFFGHGIDGANVSILSVVDGMSSYILLAVLLSDANRMNLPCSILLRNQTCSAWAQDFANAFGGYIDNPSATSACRYCQYVVGDQFFDPLNISFSNRWRDVFIIFSFFGKLLLVS